MTWIDDGRDVLIDYRWSAGDPDVGRRYAAELVALAPDVMLAGGGATVSLLQATRTVPIVFANVPDPVQTVLRGGRSFGSAFH
jgi:putative ABC transport system substrate-binding protein